MTSKPIIFGLLVLCAIFWSCTEASAPKAPDPFTVQLKWVHQAQFAGFYMARERGFYADEHLDVRFLEGGQGIDNAEALISGRADVAVVAPEDVLTHRGLGHPLIAIAAIYRRSAVVFLSRVDSGILRPFDFVDKTIAAAGRDGAVRDIELQLHALVSRLGLDDARIRVVPYDPEYTGLIEGRVDVSAAYLTGGAIRLRQKGVATNQIWPGDYGIHFYSDTLAITEALAAAHPERVVRFLRATLRGWQAAVDDPDAAVQATLRYARIQDLDLQTAMMEAQLPLIHTGEDGIGWMRAEDWDRMHEILVSQRILPSPLTDLDRAYTLSFLQAASDGGAQ